MLAPNGARPATEDTVSGSQKFLDAGNVKSCSRSEAHSQVILVLCRNRSTKAIVEIVRDDNSPAMFRIIWPDGQVSQPVNLSRAKDAARKYFDEGYTAGSSQKAQNCSTKSRAVFFWASQARSIQCRAGEVAP